MSKKSPSSWRDGWHPAAKQLSSPNFNARPPGVDVSLIVVHSISLPPGCYGSGQVQRLFTNQLNWQAHPYFQTIDGLQVSAHFFIERTAALWQFVSCNQRAWHAGASSYRGRANCNDYAIGIELEGLEGESFEPQQYSALAQLCQTLAQHYPIDAIAGHEHIAPERKHDPGPGFSWSTLQELLPWPRDYFPPAAAPAPPAPSAC